MGAFQIHPDRVDIKVTKERKYQDLIPVRNAIRPL